MAGVSAGAPAAARSVPRPGLALAGEGGVLDDDEDRNRGARGERREHSSLRALRSPRFSVISGAETLARAGLKPITLGPKEGLALINGTQPSTAVLALALAAAEQLTRAADRAAALSIDALRGSLHPFDARIHDARPFPGQRATAASIRALMRRSGIHLPHQH